MHFFLSKNKKYGKSEDVSTAFRSLSIMNNLNNDNSDRSAVETLLAVFFFLIELETLDDNDFYVVDSHTGHLTRTKIIV